MNLNPRPGELYRDNHGHTFAVVEIALSLDLNRRVVVYRVKGSTSVVTLAIDKWEELIEAQALKFVGLGNSTTPDHTTRSES